MEKRLNFNKEVDDLSKINKFFQDVKVPSEEELAKVLKMPQVTTEQTKST